MRANVSVLSLSLVLDYSSLTVLADVVGGRKETSLQRDARRTKLGLKVATTPRHAGSFEAQRARRRSEYFHSPGANLACSIHHVHVPRRVKHMACAHRSNMRDSGQSVLNPECFLSFVSLHLSQSRYSSVEVLTGATAKGEAHY